MEQHTRLEVTHVSDSWEAVEILRAAAWLLPDRLDLLSSGLRLVEDPEEAEPDEVLCLRLAVVSASGRC